MEASDLFFFRDSQVFDLCKIKTHALIVATGSNDKPCGAFPQCSILPVQQYSRYCAPFCYKGDSK